MHGMELNLKFIYTFSTSILAAFQGYNPVLAASALAKDSGCMVFWDFQDRAQAIQCQKVD